MQQQQQQQRQRQQQQQQQQQCMQQSHKKTNLHNNPTPLLTSIGHSPHPPTCMWVG